MSGQLGGDKPWQVNEFAGSQKAVRMRYYRQGMAALIFGSGAWWWYTSKHQDKLHDEAVEKFGTHGEKASYGASFKETVPSQKTDHFPVGSAGPTTDTNAAGGHDRGTRPGPP